MAIWSKLGLSGPAAAAGGAVVVLLAVGGYFIFARAPLPNTPSTAAQQLEPAALPKVAAVEAPKPTPDPALELAPDPTPEPVEEAAVTPTSDPIEEPVIVAEAASEPAPEPDPEAQSGPAPELETPEETAEAIPEAAPDVPAPALPAFDVVQVQPGGGGVIAGRGEPNQTVKLLLDGVPFAESRADRSGKFGLVLDFPASDAPRSLSIVSVLEDGTELPSSGTLLISPVAAPKPEPELEPEPESEPEVVAEIAPELEVTIEIAPEPEVEPAPDVVTQATQIPTPEPEPEPEPKQQREAPVVVLADAEGISVIQPAQRPNVPKIDDTAPQVANVVVDTITYDTEGEVALTGRGASTGFVRVYLDGQPVTTTQIAENGAWTAPLPQVDAGVYTLRVDEVSADGVVTSRVETPFQRESPDVVAAAPAGPQAVTVQPGFTLWAIARDKFGAGEQYVRVYEANRDLIRDPDLIYPGQVFAIPEG